MSDDADVGAALVQAIAFMLQEERWMDYAACQGVDTKVFFPDRGQPATKAAAYCSACPVTEECKDYRARSGSEYGVWGGELRSRGVSTPIVVRPQIAANEKQELSSDSAASTTIADPDPPIDDIPVEILPEELPMIPRSLSATAAQAYEECPKRFQVEFLNRAPSPSNEAADLGTACHEAIEYFVAEKHYLLDGGAARDAMKAQFDRAYWKLFSDSSRYDEGLKMVMDWIGRQDWTGRTVLCTEEKKNFKLPLPYPVLDDDGNQVTHVEFRYIMDRMDRLANGDIEVIDYKSYRAPVSVNELKHKLQVRCYALAAQLEYPDAEKIWVTFDLLRYDSIGVAFTKEENRATWVYLVGLLKRIVADEEPQEVLGSGCKWCIRAANCQTLQRHVEAEGILGITDLDDAAGRLFRTKSAIAGLKTLESKLNEIVNELMEAGDEPEVETANWSVRMAVSGKRVADPERVRQIVGDHLMAKYGNINITQIDEMLKSDDLSTEQKSQVRQVIRKNYGDPYPKVDRVPQVFQTP